jgi:hypothetical protein
LIKLWHYWAIVNHENCCKSFYRTSRISELSLAWVTPFLIGPIDACFDLKELFFGQNLQYIFSEHWKRKQYFYTFLLHPFKSGIYFYQSWELKKQDSCHF